MPDCALHGLGHDQRRNRFDLERGLRFDGRGADRKDHVAIEQRAVRRDAPRECVTAGLGERLELHAIEIGMWSRTGWMIIFNGLPGPSGSGSV